MSTGQKNHPSDDHNGQGRARVNAVAPIRICDIGGRTDTWFAKRGCTCL